MKSAFLLSLLAFACFEQSRHDYWSLPAAVTPDMLTLCVPLLIVAALMAHDAAAMLWLGVLLGVELIWHRADYSDATLICLLILAAISIACGGLPEASDS